MAHTYLTRYRTLDAIPTLSPQKLSVL